ncbi:MATE family efflux transporter [Pseudomonadales bacterium]|nr:MATE family efflux transporter [Pseudomonadales bacterium]MDB9879683.1 MATE family efflux transporter [Pseudomonadales bacterium]MDB9916528.1 MATE family efflux transporter [Pseudomonadales bacterium]
MPDSLADETQVLDKPQLSIWQLAWPAIISNLLFSVIGLVSIKIVGSLGASAVASATTGNRIFFALQAIMMAISAGTTAMVARSVGAKNYTEAAKVTSVSLWIGNVVAVLLMVPCIIFAREMAGVFGLDETTTADAARFIQWISVFNVAFAINMILSASLRAAGDTRTPLWIGVLTNVVNVALVYWLVFGGYGVPAMGVAGAAIANGLSFTLAAMVYLGLWYGGRLKVGVGGRGSMTEKRVRQLIDIGYPAGVEQLVFQLGFLAFLWLVGYYGTAAFAAYGIGVQILSLSFVVGFGFSIAGATLVGQHMGAKDPQGAMRHGWRATGMAIASMVGLSVFIIAFSEDIARFLIDDDEVVRLTVIFIYILGIAQPLMAIEFTLGGCLRGAGDTRFPLKATMAGLIGARVGLAALFTFMGLTVVWIYAALIGDYIVKALMLVSRFKSGKWQQVFSDAEKKFDKYN